MKSDYMSYSFAEINKKANKSLNTIIDSLTNDYVYYEADFEYEYSSFEEDIKLYCDSYAQVYFDNNACEVFFKE